MLFSGEQSSNSLPSNDDTETVCENGVCYKRPKQNKPESVSEENTSTNNSSSSSASQLTGDDKLTRAKELIEIKRKDKEEEDARVSSIIIIPYQNDHSFFF